MNCGVNIQLWFVQSDRHRAYQMNVNLCFLQEACRCQDEGVGSHIFSQVEHLAWHRNTHCSLEKIMKCALFSKEMIPAISEQIKSQLWGENEGPSGLQNRLGMEARRMFWGFLWHWQREKAERREVGGKGREKEGERKGRLGTKREGGEKSPIGWLIRPAQSLRVG